MKDTNKNIYLAADFGGGSGRVIAGFLLHGKLELEEVHRFPNRQVKLGNHVYWDFPALFEDMKSGLKLAAQKGYNVKGIGIDTWGVDFGLIDKHGNLLDVYKRQYQYMTEEKIHKDRTGGWWALSPLFVFLCLYLVTSILVNDFYKVPITVAFLISCLLYTSVLDIQIRAVDGLCETPFLAYLIDCFFLRASPFGNKIFNHEHRNYQKKD